MGSTRIKGSALSLTFGGVNYWADVTEARLTNVSAGEVSRTLADGSVSFAPRRFLIKGTAIQSLDNGSFWRYAWANSGQTVAFRYAPLGNHTPTANAPHFVGRVQIGPHPTVGGEAGASEFEFEYEWEVIGQPDLDDGSKP